MVVLVTVLLGASTSAQPWVLEILQLSISFLVEVLDRARFPARIWALPNSPTTSLPDIPLPWPVPFVLDVHALDPIARACVDLVPLTRTVAVNPDDRSHCMMSVRCACTATKRHLHIAHAQKQAVFSGAIVCDASSPSSP